MDIVSYLISDINFQLRSPLPLLHSMGLSNFPERSDSEQGSNLSQNKTQCTVCKN